ncbi:MAG: hypothetical protein JOZ03_08515 [Gammaproteobacteria bacterium]|nr:hypothetical protein [Gammaproteobacteria bacterium]
MQVYTSSAGERFLDMQFEVTDVLKGSIQESVILVREPVSSQTDDSDRSRDDGESGIRELILALGTRDPRDGSYSAAPGFSNGFYRVVSGQDGDSVLVNGLGVDADSVSPKDVHRKIANAKVPMEVFRRIAQSDVPQVTAGKDAPGAVTPASVSIQHPSAHPGFSQETRAPASLQTARGRAGGGLRMAIAAAAIAIATWFFLRRTNTSRRR